jgi:hypothetical protein
MNMPQNLSLALGEHQRTDSDLYKEEILLCGTAEWALVPFKCPRRCGIFKFLSTGSIYSTQGQISTKSCDVNLNSGIEADHPRGYRRRNC